MFIIILSYFKLMVKIRKTCTFRKCETKKKIKSKKNPKFNFKLK